MTSDPSSKKRTVVFISKATPGDNEFALWLAPRLEAAGYTVFSDSLSLEGGDRWRKEITGTLQDRAVKMLLCCRDDTLAKEGVQEEIGIGLDLAKSLPDPKFVIPLRLEPYKKLFGIGELQYIDFVRGWAEGLSNLLDTLRRQKVPCDKENAQINPNWEIFRRRDAVAIKHEPERLTSNWLQMSEIPDVIRFFEPIGAVDNSHMKAICNARPYPTQQHANGILSFSTLDEINVAFASLSRFRTRVEVPLLSFMEDGLPALNIRKQEATNIIHSLFRQAWNNYCRARGLREYWFSNAVGFHASKNQVKLRQKTPWGRQGERRSSMLRNIAKGNIWEYGVTGLPAFWPFAHFKLKSRVIFSPVDGEDAAQPYDDARKQHRLRRTICKGWRNKQWHGRLHAFLELLSQDSAFINLALGDSAYVKLEASPILFTSPVSTDLPDILTDEDEEIDETTLGRPEPDEEP